MKKSMSIEHHTNPKPLSENNIEGYLKSIKFDERSEQGNLSDEELKKILRHNLEKDFQGKITQGFIMGLGSAIYEECPKDDILLTVTCMMEDIHDPHLRKSPIKEVFRSALDMLKKDRDKKIVQDRNHDQT